MPKFAQIGMIRCPAGSRNKKRMPVSGNVRVGDSSTKIFGKKGVMKKGFTSRVSVTKNKSSSSPSSKSVSRTKKKFIKRY